MIDGKVKTLERLVEDSEFDTSKTGNGSHLKAIIKFDEKKRL